MPKRKATEEMSTNPYTARERKRRSNLDPARRAVERSRDALHAASKRAVDALRDKKRNNEYAEYMNTTQAGKEAWHISVRRNVERSW